MAEIITELDMRKLSRRIEITLTHVQNVRWRLWLSMVLIRLAAWIAPLQIKMNENLLRPWLFYCAYCGHDFSDSFKSHSVFIVQCPHCNRQCWAQSDADEAWTVKIMEGKCDCGYNCGYDDRYGFVPETGCPVHTVAEMNCFLLFVDRELYDHDCQVIDFMKSFGSLQEAQAFYDSELRETTYAAVIAEYDGVDLKVVRRTAGYSTSEIKMEPGWVTYIEFNRCIAGRIGIVWDGKCEG